MRANRQMLKFNADYRMWIIFEVEQQKKTVVAYARDLFCFALGDARVCCLPVRLFMITVIISFSFDAKIEWIFSF